MVKHGGVCGQKDNKYCFLLIIENALNNQILELVNSVA